MKNRLLVGLLLGTFVATLLYAFGIISGDIFLCVAACLVVGGYIVVDSLLLEKGRDSVLLLKALGAILLAVIMAGGSYITLKNDYNLIVNGTQTIARVSGYEKTVSIGRRGRVGSLHTHTIVYEGHTAKLNLEEQYPIGTQLPVRYLPSYPKFVRAMKPDVTAYSLLDWGTGVFFLFVCYLLFLGGWYVKEFLYPNPKPQEESL